MQHVVIKRDNDGNAVDTVEYEVVNLCKLSKTQRQQIVNEALATSEQSNEEFERKFHDRVQRYVVHALHMRL